MTPLVDRVRCAIERDTLLPPGSRVLAAVSGGADSVAMVHLLLALAPACGFELAGLAHLNHGLRGEESDGDETFCRELTARLGLRLEVQRDDVGARARAVVRPLLDVRHRELLDYLAGEAIAFREDSSNRDVGIPRNWIRHELLPLLAARMNSDIVEVLARDARVLRDEAALIELLASKAAGTIDTTTPEGGIRLDGAGLRGLPVALARRVVRQAAARIDGAGFLGFDHVERVLALAGDANPHTAADLPGVRVERNGADVVLSSRGPGQAPPDTGFRVPLSVPGRISLPQCGCTIEAGTARVERVQVTRGTDLATGSMVATVDEAATVGGLWVRSRRPGDRLRPLGMSGRKKLQDVLVDRKVPREARDRVPLVVDGHDEIVWVGGHVIGHDARVTERTQTVVILKLTRLGES